MKKQLLILSLFLSAGSFLNAQTLNWAKNSQNSGQAFSRSMVTDANDNVYVVGNYNGTVDFDPGANVSNLTSTGFDDCYIQKLDANGNFVWAKSFGGTAYDYAWDIAATSDGKLYLLGIFQNVVDFDLGPNIENKTSNGDYDCFVLKLDLNGDFQSVSTFGSTGDDRAASIVANNSFYSIVCSVSSAIDFDFSASTNNASGHVFAKYLADGTFQFAYGLGGSGEFTNLTMDNNNNLYPVGFMAGVVDFDPSANDASISSNGIQDAFVVKYDENGNYTWAKNFGGANNEISQAVAVDNSGNVIISGYFNSTVDFDNTAGTYNITATGVNDIFLVKMDSNGGYIWAKSMQGSGDKRCNSVYTDANRNVFTSGYFKDASLTICPNDANYTINNTGQFSGFVTVFKEDGTFHNAHSFDGTENVLLSACMNTQQDYIFGGYLSSTFDADPTSGTQTLSADGTYGNTVISWKYADLVGLEDIKANSLAFSIYPNPTSSILNIQITENTSLAIVNLLGKVVAIQSITAGENTVDVSNLTNGVYFIKTTNGATVKFVKE